VVDNDWPRKVCSPTVETNVPTAKFPEIALRASVKIFTDEEIVGKRATETSLDSQEFRFVDVETASV